jgi:hypothetical protein
MYARAILVLCLAAACAPAQSVDGNLLAFAKQRVTAYLTQLPNYVCRVNIERFEQTSRRGKLARKDRLHLEIAFVEGRELYALPGSKKFESRPIGSFTGGTGAISTGSYAMHVREVFMAGRPIFKEAALTQIEGRDHIRIAFEIPRVRSSLRVQDGRRAAIAGYSGFALLSPDTFALEELRISIDDVPPEITIEKSSETTTYHQVRIGDKDLALPASTELSMFTRDGHYFRNVVNFEGCRRYGVETTISYSDAPETGSAPAPPTPLDVRSGASVMLELQTPVNDKAAIGDPVSARVVDGGKALPKGAIVTGHITRVGRRAAFRSNYFLVGMRFEDVETEGRHGDFQARLESVAVATTLGQNNAYLVMEPPDNALPGEGMLWVREREFPLRKGFRMTWRTE